MFVCIRMISVYCYLSLLLLNASAVFSEQVDLKSGKTVDGRIIAKTGKDIKVDTGLKIWRIPFRMMTPESAEKWGALENFLTEPTEPPVTIPPPGLILPANIQKEDIASAWIIQQVKEAYHAFDTIQYESLQRTSYDNEDYEKNAVYFSTVKLGRPNKYIVSDYTIQSDGQITFKALWNNGISPYVYSDRTQEYKSFPEENFLGSFAPYSAFIPGLFYDQRAMMERLQSSIYAGSAELEGLECYLLVHSKSETKSYTYWVSQTSFLILMVDIINQGLLKDLDSDHLTEDQPGRILQSQGSNMSAEDKKIFTQTPLAQEEFLGDFVNDIKNRMHTQLFINDIRVNEEISMREFTFQVPDEAVYVQSTDIRTVVDNAKDVYPSNQ
ncbi:MAG: hypothetical protein K8S27_09425 [Candidatus Omnitrophica bacterium]|nr:hypothetical protein [Candidatus Omnitrophota bacterium]